MFQAERKDEELWRVLGMGDGRKTLTITGENMFLMNGRNGGIVLDLAS